MSYALGKKPATPSPKDLRLVEFVAKKRLPTAKVGFGHENVVSQWGMLGNDNYGDCVFAGGAHETMLWNAIVGKQVPFNDQVVLGDYSAVTGFNPSDPNSDQGTDMRVALDYRRHTGLQDAGGSRHLLGAYVALEPGNTTQLYQALNMFDAVAIGIEFPSSAMGQFDSGKPWSVVKGASIDGGHYVPVVGRPTSSSINVVTWGRVQRMTSGFYKKYCDEAYGIFSPEVLSNGKSPEGFDLAALQDALARL